MGILTHGSSGLVLNHEHTSAYKLFKAGRFAEAEKTRIAFEMTDPLPVLKVGVQQSEDVLFFIDAGGSELIVDSEFADELGVERVGE